MNIVWKDQEVEYVRANSGLMTDKKLAENLTRITGRAVSMQSARKQRQKMGLRKRAGRGVCELDGSVLSKLAGKGNKRKEKFR